MPTKKFTLVFTDNSSVVWNADDRYTTELLVKKAKEKYPNKTVATINGEPVSTQAPKVTEPELTADTAGKKTGQVAKDTVIGTGELIGDIADGAWRFGKGFIKGVAGMDESVKAQDDAVLEKIKSIKY
jgi:hypothetical protein